MEEELESIWAVFGVSTPGPVVVVVKVDVVVVVVNGVEVASDHQHKVVLEIVGFRKLIFVAHETSSRKTFWNFVHFFNYISF